LTDQTQWVPRGENPRFEIVTREREAFNTHWVFTPTVRRLDGEVLVEIHDTKWSADEAVWHGDTIVMTMRKYPGNHRPVDLTVRVDCAAREGEIDGARHPLDRLEAAMDAALHWLTPEEQSAIQAARRQPPPPKAWWKFW
jgi:hypothetical protein